MVCMIQPAASLRPFRGALRAGGILISAAAP